MKTDKGHFWITFKNGYTISIFNGFGSYTDNHYKQELLNIENYIPIQSLTCEIAILYNDLFATNRFIDCEGDEVKGYIEPDELAELIYKVKNYNGEQNDEDNN